ncbi:MAG TPA: hypothetical protein VFA49_03780, partial [Chloroflexota bacterium]|nr:hypothetical protein [Chloroflexota bacterium]
MRRAILLGLGLAVASACGSPSQPQPTLPPPPPAPPTATPLAAPSPSPALPAPLAVPAVRPAASPSPAVVPLSVVVGYTGSDLRTSLDLLVQEHLSLAAAALDAAAANREDELGAISSSLDQSSTALAQVVGSVNGADAQQQFAEAWRRRIGSLVDY